MNMHNPFFRLLGWIGLLIDSINVAAGYLSGFFIFVISVLVTYDVVCRFVFNAPTIWVLEISVYLSMASLFLAVGYLLKEKGHINVDLFVTRLSPSIKLKLDLLTSVLALIYCFALAWEGGRIALNAYHLGETSPSLLRFPVFIPRGLVSLGGILLCLQFLKEIGSLLGQIKNPPTESESNGISAFQKAIPVLFILLLFICSYLLAAKGLSLIGLVLLLFLLLFSGFPIGMAMGFLGLLAFFLLFGGMSSVVQIPLLAYKSIDDFVMVCLPLFIMTSTVLMVGKVGSNLFEIANTWTRHLPGGLAVSSVVACAVFAAISGSSTATVITIGTIAIPALISSGYKREQAFGVLAIGGVLGPLIPPSVFMILIASMTGDSIGKLFMAGMLPGIMLVTIFSAYIILKARTDPDIPRMAKASWKERLQILRVSIWGVLTPVIILGGIYSGIFTATEAAAVSTVYGFIICGFIYRTIRWKDFRQILLKSAASNGMILFIIIGALIFGQVIAMMQVPQKVAAGVSALPFSPMVVLGFILVFILIMGALMDEISILLITYPILYYVFVNHFGFDPIWFALVFVFTLEVGLVAPPVGINLFVIKGIIKDAKFSEVVSGVLPFMFLMIASILLVVFIKPLSTWLPKLVG
jgi:C4-dicarboxylate transporter, DctM subunit